MPQILRNQKIMSDTFCAYPWDHVATLTNGAIVPCCVAKDAGQLNLSSTTLAQAWNSDYYKSIRKQMMNGEKVTACQNCYREEEQSIQSRRQQYNQYIKNLLGSFDQFLKSTLPDGEFNGPIRSLDLRLGNSCNLQCIMCRPAESTLWAKTIQELIAQTTDPLVLNDLKSKSQINSADYIWAKDSVFWNALKSIIQNVKEITIAGGEPFLIEENINFLQFCVDSNLSQNLKIRFHTNGTHLPQKVFQLFKFFKEIEIMISIDSTESQNHFLRNPTSWQNLTQNLAKLDHTEDNIFVYILSSLSAINIFYYPEFLTWFIQSNFKKISRASHAFYLPSFGLIHEPTYLCMQILTPEIKKIVRQKFEVFFETTLKNYFADNLDMYRSARDNYNHLLGFLDQETQVANLQNLKHYIKSLNHSRKLNFEESFPELSKHLFLD
jgi:organic radical activating enzyme